MDSFSDQNENFTDDVEEVDNNENTEQAATDNIDSGSEAGELNESFDKDMETVHNEFVGSDTESKDNLEALTDDENEDQLEKRPERLNDIRGTAESLLMREVELDFEADVGEDQQKDGVVKEEDTKANKEPSEEDNEDGEVIDSDAGEELAECSDGEVKDGDELEEGELSDEDGDRRFAQEPRPVCRFFNKGQCTWGANCRFLHPGVTDKGNYSMFDPPKPLVPLNGPPDTLPDFSHSRNQSQAKTRPVPEEPVFESAWERGLRHAKEMLKKSMQRKETDLDFEEKKMNLTLGQEELDKENDYYTRPASPIVREAPNRDDDLINEFYPPHQDEEYWRSHYYQRGHDVHQMHYAPPYGHNKTDRMRMPKDRMPGERVIIGEGYERRRKVPREVPPRPTDKEMRYERPRGDEWADPWMRSKSPLRRAPGNRRASYSSGSSYSSSRSSRSSSYSSSSGSSRSSSYSSYSSRSRSRSHSRSRSVSPLPRRKAPPAPRSPSPRRKAPPASPTMKSGYQRHSGPMSNAPLSSMASELGSGGRGKSQLTSPRKTPSDAPPNIPLRRGSDTSLPIPRRPPQPSSVINDGSMTRKQADTVPVKKIDNRKDSTAPLGSKKELSSRRKRTSSMSDRSSRSRTRSRSWSDSSSNSSRSRSRSSSSSSRDPSPPPVSKDVSNHQRKKILMMLAAENKLQELNAAAKTKAMDALKVSGQKQQIKLTLKAPGPVQVNKRVLEKLSDEREPEVRAPKPAPVARKRSATSPPPFEPTAKVTPVVKPVTKKPPLSRREELLKQLKAVEEAIARKRSKLGP